MVPDIWCEPHNLLYLDNFNSVQFSFNIDILCININCYCHGIDLGFSLLGKIIKLVYQPDIITFNIFIDGLHKMVDQGIQLDNYFWYID